MARKKRKARAERIHREPIVREVAELLKTGSPTWWRYTSEAHRGLRAGMCLKGMAWSIADQRAEEIVTLARHRIGLSRYPSWTEAQGETPQEREFYFCACCGGHMPEGNDRPWCSDECRLTLNSKARHATGRRDDEARRRATRVILSGGAPEAPVPLERLCRKCGKLFKPTHPDKRYCSRSCAAKKVKYRARSCLTCASAFQPWQHKQIVCGPDCAHELRLRRLRAARVKKTYDRACTVCSKSFEARRSTQHICSPACQRAVWLEQKRESHRRVKARKREAMAMAA